MCKTARRINTIIAISILMAACSGRGGGGNATVAPPSQSEPMSVAYGGPQTFVLGAAYDTALISEAVLTSSSVSPALPPGLEIFDNGEIRGKPTSLTAAATYSFTTDNGSGPVTITTQLEVVANPIFYATPLLLTVGSPMTPLVPRLVGSLNQFHISPALPPGLVLNADTGVISGTPVGASAVRSYEIAASGHLSDFSFGIFLGTTSNPSVTLAEGSANKSYCAYSGGFVGSYQGTGTDDAYGLVAIAFTPDGIGNFHSDDLTTDTGLMSNGESGLRDLDGNFQMNLAGENAGTVTGKFLGADWIEGDIQQDDVSRHFSAARIGGSRSARLRFSGGFALSDDVYPTSFSSIDVDQAGNMAGIQYKFGTGIAINTLQFARLTSFTGSINGSLVAVNVDGSLSNGSYTASDMTLVAGDPYDELPGLFESGSSFFKSQGCQLND
jgi:hypothetical protein